MIAHLLKVLKDDANRTILQWIGSGVAALAVGAWAVFTYLHPSEPLNNKPEPSGPSVVIGKDVQAGRDVTINPTVTIGPDSREINAKLDRIQALLVEKLLATSTSQTVPGVKEAVTGAVQFAERGAQAGDPRLQQALDLLKQNKVAEAQALFQQVAEASEQAARRSNAEAAAAYRHLGAIALLHEPWKAREAYAKAAALDPDNPDGLYWDGWLQWSAKNLEAAEKSYRALLQLDGKGANERQIFWARSGLGDIFVARGNLPEALKAYGEARAAMERLASSDAGNADWQRDLSVSYEKIGEVLVAQGNLAEALKTFRAVHAIFERLAASDGGNASWQRDLSVSYNKIGGVWVAQGNLAEALKSYRASLAIRERLSLSDIGNALWQRDLGVSYDNFGDVLVT
jgi:tetratricopeptide (TPR) repeat protein